MNIVSKIAVKAAISLFAGIATTIGMRLGGVIWGSCVNDEHMKDNNKRIIIDAEKV